MKTSYDYKDDSQKMPTKFWLVQFGTIITLSLFVKLGFWQLDRGDVKSEIEYLTKDDAQPIKVSLPLSGLEEWRYKKIQLRGYFSSSKQFLLDNQVRDGVAGYSVLTPFYVTGSETWVLVDRGWLAQGTDRNQFPDVSLNEEMRAISGSVYIPYGDSYSLGTIAEGEDTGWPRRIQFVDYLQLGQRIQTNIEPFTLRLGSSEPNGFRRDWVTTQLSAKKHYGYAFQWFAMSLAVLVLWWVYSIRPLLRKKTQ